MKSKLNLTADLFNDFYIDCNKHIEEYQKNCWGVIGQRNINKTSLMRRIVIIRENLLNLYKELEAE